MGFDILNLVTYMDTQYNSQTSDNHLRNPLCDFLYVSVKFVVVSFFNSILGSCLLIRSHIGETERGSYVRG